MSEVFGKQVGLECKCGFATERVVANDPELGRMVEWAIQQMTEHVAQAHADEPREKVGMCPYCMLRFEAPTQAKMLTAVLRHAMQEHLDR